MTPSPPPREPPFTCVLFNRLREDFAGYIPDERRQEFYTQLEAIRQAVIALREWGKSRKEER